MNRAPATSGRIAAALRCAACGIALWFAGCSSDDLDSTGGSSARVGAATNVCTSDADCGLDSSCEAGMCIADATRALTVYLELAADTARSDGAGMPTWLPALQVEGPVRTEFALPPAHTLRIAVVRGDAPVAATVRVIALAPAPGLPQRERSMPLTDAPLSVNLAEGATYLVIVEPGEQSGLPPLHQSITLDADQELRFDYDVIPLSSRQFEFSGAAAAQARTVVAVDPETGDPLSTRATVTDAGARLTFGPGHYAFNLLLTPAEADPDAVSEPGPCAGAGGAAPSFSLAVAADRARTDPETPPAERPARFADDAPPLTVVLPDTGDAFAYRGTVKLCTDPALGEQQAPMVALNLRSRSLLPPADAEPGSQAPPTSESEALASAAFNSAATAAFDAATGLLQFCVPVLPGTYDVVASPPGSVRCGIFAEERQLRAPAGSDEKTGDALQLGTIATLSGTLRGDAEGALLPFATLEARALATADDVRLADDDPTVTTYNRGQQATSDADGQFSLPLDLGVYDLSIKPQQDSGFGWLVVSDVRIGTRRTEIPASLTVSAPVTLRADVTGTDTDLSGTWVRAYTVVGDATGGSLRSVQLAQAMVEADGHFELLLSPTVRDGLLLP